MRRHARLQPAAYAIVAVVVTCAAVAASRLAVALIAYAQRALDALPPRAQDALWRELHAA